MALFMLPAGVAIAGPNLVQKSARDFRTQILADVDCGAARTAASL
jgi:hypothetical protein